MLGDGGVCTISAGAIAGERVNMHTYIHETRLSCYEPTPTLSKDTPNTDWLIDWLVFHAAAVKFHNIKFIKKLNIFILPK